jgi:hypothetical protein
MVRVLIITTAYNRDYSAHTRGGPVTQTLARPYSSAMPNLGMSPTLASSVPRVPGLRMQPCDNPPLSEPLLKTAVTLSDLVDVIGNILNQSGAG